jgi:hypothetical protein
MDGQAVNDTQNFSTGAVIGGSVFAVVLFFGWATGAITEIDMNHIRAMWPHGADGDTYGYYLVPAVFLAWTLGSGFAYAKILEARRSSTSVK